MASGKPVFFFSYARDDFNKFMEKFFTELREEVRDQTGLAAADITFHDISSLPAGERWEQHILQALQNSAVFVAMLTPTYFAYMRGKRCFCGREFAAFRSRSRGTDQTNVVSVLWTVPQTVPRDFPHAAVRDITWTLQGAPKAEIPKNYYDYGLKWVWPRDAKGRRNIRDALAARIVQLYTAPPLEPLPAVPDMDAVPCAFHDESAELAEFPVASAAAVAREGPGRLVLIYVSTGQVMPGDGGFQVQEAAFRKGYYPQCFQWQPQGTGAEGVLPTLRASSEANNTTIVVVRSDQLRHGDTHTAVEKILGDSSWSGGLLVLGQPPRSLTSATVLTGVAATPVSVPEELGRLITTLGSQVRRTGTPSPGIPDGGAPPPRF